MNRYDLHALARDHITLLRGPSAARIVLLTARDPGPAPRYSRAARAWIIPTAQLDDVAAYAQCQRLVLAITDRRVTP